MPKNEGRRNVRLTKDSTATTQRRGPEARGHGEECHPVHGCDVLSTVPLCVPLLLG